MNTISGPVNMLLVKQLGQISWALNDTNAHHLSPSHGQARVQTRKLANITRRYNLADYRFALAYISALPG